MIQELLIGIGGLGAGVAIGYLYAQGARRSAEAELAGAREQVRTAREERERMQSDMRREHQLALDALQKRFDETIRLLQAQLEAVTSRMLREREAEFSESNRELMQQIVAPLNDEIEKMRQSVVQNSERHAALGGTLSESIRVMGQQSDAARRSADRLADALSKSNRVQGHWGETVLTRLLESQGLSEGVHFDTQFTMTDASGSHARTDEGNSLRPDVILHLDDNRDVIIDSKVSLTAYLDYVNATTEAARDEALRRHVESLQNQVRLLSKKDYSKYVMPPKTRIEYVIMFVPVSAALHCAAAAKPDLWRRAMEQNVYIADEQTLYAALRIIDMTWRNIAQARNHKQVYDLAAEMLDRVGMFLESFQEIGKKLDDARTQYEKSLTKLREQGQSIPHTAKKLINLGAQPPSSSTRRRKALDNF